MSPHPKPSTEEQTTFNCLQEAIRKDVERLFGVLQFAVTKHGRQLSKLEKTFHFDGMTSTSKKCDDQ